MSFTKSELLIDIDFLAKRAGKASYITFDGERDTGSSSNAIVSLAYLGEPVSSLPFDRADLAACENMWKKLPAHRKTDDVCTAMNNARIFVD